MKCAGLRPEHHDRARANDGRPRQENLRQKKTAPSLRRFIVPDLRFDFLAVCLNVCPGVDEILRPQGWVIGEQIGLRHSEAARLLEQPHLNSRAPDARLPAADTGGRLDSRKGVSQVARDPLEKLSLLGTC